MLISKGSGDYGYNIFLFAPGFNFELKFEKKILSYNQFQINSNHIHDSDQSKLC